MKIKRSIIFALICTLLLSSSVFCVNAKENEFVEFGTYPKSEVAETTELKNAEYNEKGDAVVGKNRYRKIEENGKNRYFLCSNFSTYIFIIQKYSITFKINIYICNFFY